MGVTNTGMIAVESAECGAIPEALFPPTDGMASFVQTLVGEPVPPPSNSILSTGSNSLDKVIGGGLCPGHLSLVAGVAGVGTSTFALGIGRHAAFRRHIRTAFIAPDSSEIEVLSRVVAAEVGVDVGAVRDGRLDESQRQAIQEARDHLTSAPLWVNAEFAVPATADVVLDAVRYMTDGDGARLVIVDGISQVEPHSRELMLGLRILAQARGLVIVVVSKAVTPASRQAEAPLFHDLRDYGAVADLCDLVLMLHREELHSPNSARPGEADVEIVKHRYGPLGRTTIAYQGHYARFVDMAR